MTKPNLCHPDSSKSCAACCGLYNVTDATRPTLERRLRQRTALFAGTGRSPDDIERYAELVRTREAVVVDSPWAYVCEFSGFVDSEHRVIGCMLHPLAPGNSETDLRGLCYYGSLACKLFYCPAWHCLPEPWVRVVAALTADWHLYGLVITDVDYIRSVFGLVEARLGVAVDDRILHLSHAVDALRTLLSWKDSWPWAAGSTLRRSSQGLRFHDCADLGDVGQHVETMLKRLRFTFGLEATPTECLSYVMETLDRLLRTPSDQPGNLP
jgi:hypothetical protein